MPDTLTHPAAELVFALDAFDGPLDLLLYLIRKDEIDIYDIPIAEVTRQYLAYLDACRELNLEVAGEFLYMASMLIRIKAQMLLPGPESEVEEDPREELVNALLEYRKIKHLSSHLEELAVDRARCYPRGNYSLENFPQPEPELIRVDLTALMIAFGELVRRMPRDAVFEIQPQEITVEMRKSHVLGLFEKYGSLEFEKLFEDDYRKIVMVVTFVAILELVKVGILKVEQATRFSPIRLCRGEVESSITLESA